MGPAATVSLTDELTGDTVEVTTEPGWLGGDLIEAQLAAQDHPRADFRGRELDYVLIGADQEPLDPASPLPADQPLTLRSPEGAEVRGRRDQWLAALDTGPMTEVSITPSAQLTLIERTRSRLDEVTRLRARVLADRQALLGHGPGAVTARRRRWPWVTAAAVLITVLGGGAVAALVVFWFSDTGSVTAPGGGPPSGDLVSLPFEQEMALDPGARHHFTFLGQADQNITILMLVEGHPEDGSALDPELELVDADGNRISYNDDRLDLRGGLVLNPLSSRIDITLPTDGDYTVIAGDLSDHNGGEYTMIIEEGGPGGPGQPGPDWAEEEGWAEDESEAWVMVDGERHPFPDIVCGEAEPREIEVPFEEVVTVDGCVATILVFEQDAPRLVTFEVRAADGPEGADPIIWVRQDGAEIATNDDSAGLSSFLLLELEQGTTELVIANLTGEVAGLSVTIFAE